MTQVSKKDEVILERVLYIHYRLYFQKNTIEVKTLIDSGSEVNAIIPGYALKLDLKIRHTNVRAQKIDDSILEMFAMILASF